MPAGLLKINKSANAVGGCMTPSARAIISDHEKAELDRKEGAGEDLQVKAPVLGKDWGPGYYPRTPRDPHDPTKLVPR